MSSYSRAKRLTSAEKRQGFPVDLSRKEIKVENFGANETGSIKGMLARITEGENLSETASAHLMQQILAGSLTPVQMASLVTALKMKGETAAEVTGFARAMRAHSTRVALPFPPEEVIDTCGTGGDAPNTFNISTASALVAAACGQKVAKHGNRAVSSTCGSADILEALGVNLDIGVETIQRCLEQVGFGFLYAPKHHQSMKHAKEPRREMGLKTIFNLLGPLTNPAGAAKQLIGVYDASLTDLMAQVLAKLGTKKAWVVHGYDGMDEISICAATKVTQLEDGVVTNFLIDPEDYGLNKAPLKAIAGKDKAYNAQIINKILQGEKGACRDVVLLNAGASLVVGGKASTLEEGIQMAATQIDNGKAKLKLAQLKQIAGEVKTS